MQKKWYCEKSVHVHCLEIRREIGLCACVCVWIYGALQSIRSVYWVPKSIPTEQHEEFSFTIFAVHQNRIEFIVVNWISLFIVPFFSRRLCSFSSSSTMMLTIASNTSILSNRLVTRHKTESTLLHFIYHQQVSQLFQSSFQILRIMFRQSHKNVIRWSFFIWQWQCLEAGSICRKRITAQKCQCGHINIERQMKSLKHKYHR